MLEYILKGVIFIKLYRVKPLSSKKENVYLILAFIFILFASTISLKLRIKKEPKQILHSNEISSYESLNNIEIDLYTELSNALMEISMLKEEYKQIPSVEILEKEGIPPFFKDHSWGKKGKIEWSLIFHDNIPLYIGKSQNISIGNFLVEIETSNIEKSKIYYFKEDIENKIFENNYDIVKTKLKYIVPYTGKNEKEKIKEGEL